MRTISVPQAALEAAIAPETRGDYISVAVRLDWPELRLTEAQVLANAHALVAGAAVPFPDPSIVTLELPRLVAARPA